MINVLAPGVIQHHITGGAQWKVNDRWDLELAAMYAPKANVRGTELPLFGPTPALEISMYQFEITAGIKYRFGP